MGKKSSIYDIAQKLGITASTVSRALRDHSNISEEVKKRVNEVARELNYKRNAIAVNLKQGSTRTIGVVIPQLNRHFFSSAINGIEEVASEAGYNVIICQTRNDVRQEKKAVQMLSESVVDGFIISVVTDVSDYSHFRNLQDQGIPVIFFDRYPMSDEFKRVSIDDFLASSQAVTHLAAAGRTKIFHFAGDQSVSIWHERTRGYVSAMKQLGITVKPDWIFKDTLNLEAGMQAVERMILSNNIPDAIFSSSDHPLLGALSAFKKHGFRIPKDIAMVGYGNEIFSPFTEPPMSTVDQHSYEMGKLAFTNLLKCMEGAASEVPKQSVLPHELVIRGSSFLPDKP